MVNYDQKNVTCKGRGWQPLPNLLRTNMVSLFKEALDELDHTLVEFRTASLFKHTDHSSPVKVHVEVAKRTLVPSAVHGY